MEGLTSVRELCLIVIWTVWKFLPVVNVRVLGQRRIKAVVAVVSVSVVVVIVNPELLWRLSFPLAFAAFCGDPSTIRSS